MGDLKEAWKKIKELTLSFSNEFRHKYAEAWKKYINLLPEEERNTIMCTLRGKSIKLKDIPEAILKDDEVLQLLLNIYGE